MNFTLSLTHTCSDACLAASSVASAWPRALALLLLAGALVGAGPLAVAQVPQRVQNGGASVDPPGRVARMSLAEGPVSRAGGDNLLAGGNGNWTPVELNRPLTSGDRLWSGPGARAELHVGSTAVRLGEQTSLDFLALDDDTTQLRLAQGTLKLRVRTLFEGQRLEVNTPNLAFVITQPGDYRVDANPANPAGGTAADATRVVVQQGAGAIYGDGGASVTIAAGQQAHFTDTQLTPAGPAPGAQDDFDAWALQRDRLEDQSVSARYIPREVVGYQQLDSHGDWNQDPTYGAVWLPRAVPSNWAPYRDGHWNWIAPWGWTWVDDAPWGFAPFHYGRWTQIGPRWGWVPGRLTPQPVYAPALVGFIGGQSGGVSWNISLGQQAAQPALGWFPLAPGEAYRPAYRHSPRYVSRVNHNIVVNNVNVIDTYRYQRRGDAISALSEADFARGQRVRPEAQRLNPADLGRAQVLTPNRVSLPQRPVGAMAVPALPFSRGASLPALPPAAIGVRPVVTSQLPPLVRRDERGDRTDRGDRSDARPDARPDGRLGGQRPWGDESIGQRALREQAERNGSFNAGAPSSPPVMQGRPDYGRDPIEQAQREQQRLAREQQRQQYDAVRQQEQQRQQNGESIGQRALREQAQRQFREQPARPQADPGRNFERQRQPQ